MVCHWSIYLRLNWWYEIRKSLQRTRISRLNVIGIIACTAQSINTLIGANVMLGLAAGVQYVPIPLMHRVRTLV